MMFLSSKNFMGVMQESNQIWVQTWMEKIAKNQAETESLMIKEYGDCFELLFRSLHQFLPSSYLLDIDQEKLSPEADPPYFIIRDGYFTFPYGLACRPELQKFPSLRKVAIHTRLNQFVDKGPWSQQELFFYALRPASYTPRKKLVIIVHQDFWDEGEKIIVEVFQKFFTEHKDLLNQYKKIFLLDCFLDRYAQNKFLKICRQHGFPIEEVMKYKDLLYHEELSQYAYHDLGDGYMSLDSFIVHSLLRHNIIPFIKEENIFPPTAKYYPCSPRHGYYIWPRDASKDSFPDPLLYLNKQECVTDFLSKPFLNHCFEKEALAPISYAPPEIRGKKKFIQHLRHLTQGRLFDSFHKGLRLGEMSLLKFGFSLFSLPTFSLKYIEFRGSSVQKLEKNIFEADLDWSFILKNNYSDWGLSILVRLSQTARFVFPNLDTPEFYTERELNLLQKLQIDEEIAPFIKLCRLLKKMSQQCNMVSKGTKVDQEKALSSLRRAMTEMGQPHMSPNEQFFPLVIDLDYYFSHLNTTFENAESNDFNCDIYSPYLGLWFNKESLIEFKFSHQLLKAFLSVLPDATFSSRQEFVELRKKSPALCLAYVGMLADDWILGRSVQRLICFKQSTEQYKVLKGHLSYLKEEYHYWKKFLGVDFLKSELGEQLELIFDLGAEQ